MLAPDPVSSVCCYEQVAGNMVCVCVLSAPEIREVFVTLYFTERIQPALLSLFKISLFSLTLLCPCLNIHLASERPHICVFNSMVKLYINKIGVARGRLRHGRLLTPLQIFWNLQLSEHELSSLSV